MEYSGAAWEQAMRMQDVILWAMSGEIHWFQAADILQMTPRNLRRWRERQPAVRAHRYRYTRNAEGWWSWPTRSAMSVSRT